MTLALVTRIFALTGMAVGLIGMAQRLRQTLQRAHKLDLSRPRGSKSRGILYAFTLGMAPWEKESTRKHWVAYLRGIFFHIGTFTAYAVVLIAPFLNRLLEPAVWVLMLLTGVGSVMGFAGIYIRYAGENERLLSLPDDYFSVFLTSFFILIAFAALFSDVFAPALYAVAGILSVYAPFSKIRHCAYFFYSKFFFGKSFGHRGVLGPGNQKVVR